MIEVFFDGSCWPNPGSIAKGGYAIYNCGQLVTTGDGGIINEEGITNNCAEYAGLEASLLKAAQLFGSNPITVYGDSKMVIDQMTGAYKKPKPKKRYYAYYLAALKAAGQFPAIDYQWIPRLENAVADKAAEIEGVVPMSRAPSARP